VKEMLIAKRVRESMVEFLAGNIGSVQSPTGEKPFKHSGTSPRSSFSFWSEVSMTRNQHHLLSWLALSLLITPASEAASERTLSRLKNVMRDRMGNLKDKPLFSMFVITE
jgi:hypothetical protein